MNALTQRIGGLQARLLMIIVLGAVLFSIAAGALSYRLGQDRAVYSGLETLKDLAQAVEKTVAIGAFASDQVLLTEVVDGLARNPLVLMAQVQLNNGDILAQNPRLAIANLDIAEHNHVTKLLYSPFDTQEQIGILYIFTDQSQIATLAKKEAMTLATMMISQTTLVAMLLYGVVAILVSRPIMQLARQLHGMSPGTSERLVTPIRHRNDEIGTLIGGANALLNANAVAINREREMRAVIEAMEAQYRQIFDSSSAGIFVIDDKGRLINSNPRVSKVIGMPVSAMRNLSSDDFINRVFDSPEQVHAMIQDSKRTRETVSGDLELVKRDNTRRRWVHCLISVHNSTKDTGKSSPQTLTEGVMYDITERKNTEKAVRYQAEHDALTGIKNRAASHSTIDRFITESMTNQTAMSLLCIDLDGFKQINDHHGHYAGDQVLIACAKRMKRVVRESNDLVGRLGGDEFVVALQNIGPSDPALGTMAKRLLAVLCGPITIKNGIQVQVGASIGIACTPLHGMVREDLFDAADASMYDVKRTGKNNFAMGIPITIPSK